MNGGRGVCSGAILSFLSHFALTPDESSFFTGLLHSHLILSRRRCLHPSAAHIHHQPRRRCGRSENKTTFFVCLFSASILQLRFCNSSAAFSAAFSASFFFPTYSETSF